RHCMSTAALPMDGSTCRFARIRQSSPPPRFNPSARSSPAHFLSSALEPISGSIEPAAPVVRPTACMRERHHFDVVVVIAVDDEEWEVPQWNSSGGTAQPRSRNDFADQWKL